MPNTTTSKNNKRLKCDNSLQYSNTQDTISLLQQIEILQQKERTRLEFLSNISHELRTPLNSIINFNRFIIRRDLGNITEAQETALKQCVKSAEQLLRLINDLLDVSKIESGKTKLFIESNIDITEYLVNVISQAELMVQDKPIKLSYDISDLPTITGDSRRIRQAILNLISNACKFTEVGTIRVTATTLEDNILILVADTGPGILTKDLSKIFEPFEQTQLGMANPNSTGLGLSITKTYIEAHGGKMIVDSQVGVGSTFGFSIPICSPHLVKKMQEDMYPSDWTRENFTSQHTTAS